MEGIETFSPAQMAAVLAADRKSRQAESRCDWRQPPPPCPVTRPRYWEVATTGYDEFGQGFGIGPYGGPPTSVGLRVPFLPTGGDATGRYLFALCSFSLNEGECCRILGYRQLATIGLVQTSGDETSVVKRVIEQQITSPMFRFWDGDISWHIRFMGAPNAQSISQGQKPGAADMNSFSQYWTTSPALLYGNPAPDVPIGNIYPNIATYTPPNGGRPYGDPIPSKQGDFFDLRTQWLTHGAWGSLNLIVEGPETVCFFASVRQTNPSGRPVITPPSPFYAGGLSPEEQFILNFPAAQFWRVGGSLIVEEM